MPAGFHALTRENVSLRETCRGIFSAVSVEGSHRHPYAHRTLRAESVELHYSAFGGFSPWLFASPQGKTWRLLPGSDDSKLDGVVRRRGQEGRGGENRERREEKCRLGPCGWRDVPAHSLTGSYSFYCCFLLTCSWFCALRLRFVGASCQWTEKKVK